MAGDPALTTADAFKSVTAATLPGYVAGLTPVLLRADTLVTAHGLETGATTARQSVLQAGTAVLVDERGLPRLRCASGSPLTSPARNAPTANRAGEPWPGFDLSATVVMTPAVNPIRQFGLVDPTGATTFRRPVGTAGPQDIDQVPRTALLDGTYALHGTTSSCDGFTSCDKSKPLTMTVQLRDCSPARCTIATPDKYWIGDLPFTAADGRWSVSGPTGSERANTCDDVVNPTTVVELSVTPGDFVVDTEGIWRANSLAGTVRRYNGAFATCHAGSRTWDVTAKRSLTG